jgi:hypothetical protein
MKFRMSWATSCVVTAESLKNLHEISKPGAIRNIFSPSRPIEYGTAEF